LIDLPRLSRNGTLLQAISVLLELNQPPLNFFFYGNILGTHVLVPVGDVTTGTTAKATTMVGETPASINWL
jgi:hypothetical protein